MEYNRNFKLKPKWITGFVDAEGCFTTSIYKSNKLKIGWRISPIFQIKLHKRDIDLLKNIKSFFNCGNVYNYKDGSIRFIVQDVNSINNIIIPHFEKYPLITQKQGDFMLWKNIVELINKREHIIKEGLIKIINIKASLNKGLPKRLNTYFSNIIMFKRPIINLDSRIDSNWFAGFFSGEGCFYIRISKSNAINLSIQIGQHSRDKELIYNLINKLNCGYVREELHKNFTKFIVSKFEDIHTKIIPLFNKYNIEGTKYMDFQDFCKAAELINKKAHLTLEGLEKIREIKFGMNKGRLKL